MYQEDATVTQTSEDQGEIQTPATETPEDVPSAHKPLKLGDQRIRVGLSRSRPVQPLLKQRRINP